MSEQADASVDRFPDDLDDHRDELEGRQERRRAGLARPGWEYMTWGTDDAFGYTGGRVELVNGEDIVDDRPIYVALADAGRDGWELVNTLATKYRVVLVFKRPLVED